MRTLSRRDFIKLSGALAGSVVVSTAIQGCATGLSRKALSNANFLHGVASGDPGRDSLILWTRATAENQQQALILNWQLALDPDFQQLVRSGQVNCSAANDFTVKVDVRELSPDRQYYYRFVAKDQSSPVGRGKTLPAGQTERLKLAVFSCSNYPAGYFNVYQHAANIGDIDFTLHLGDYIYEYSSSGYATENAERIGRSLPEDNQGELLALTDYRKRYALYHTDKGLQALRAAVPMIAVWDDHEVANNTWKTGAQNHNPGEGDFQARKLAAIQAYYEWMPIRPPLGEQSPRIYRGFEFGDLVSLHMLDTRVIGRNRQLNMGDFIDQESGRLDKQSFKRALFDPKRTLLGAEQLAWLKARLSQSQARWQLLGQQVLMGKMWFPVEVFSNRDRSKIPQAIEQLATLKKKALQGYSLTDTEQQRLKRKLPYNLDAWDGYPTEREALYQALREKGGNMVVVAGDTHNAWHNHLTDRYGNRVGVEFATPSVTSPGMERYLSLNADTAPQLAQALPLLVDDLQYCNLSDRGHLQLTFTREQVTAEWQFIDNIESTTFRAMNRHQFTVT